MKNIKTAEENTKVENKFNPDKLRLSQNFGEMAGVKKKLVTVPVRKPHKQEFIRVRPGDDYRLETGILELKDDRENYLVTPDVYKEISNDAVRKVLFTAMTRQGVLFLWPVRLPDADGKLDSWNQSALEGAKFAETGWVKISSNKSLAAYEIFDASAQISEPEWPDVTFPEILEIAFKGKFIDILDHALLKTLRGEI